MSETIEIVGTVSTVDTAETRSSMTTSLGMVTTSIPERLDDDALALERPRTVRVPWGAAAAVTVRRQIVADLARRQLPSQVVDEAEIVTSELVANAFRHARALTDGTIRVHWKVKGAVVEVEVSDGGGDTVPRPSPQAVYATNGRGLRIVRSVAHEWGVTENKTGRTVWASIGGPSRRRTQ